MINEPMRISDPEMKKSVVMVPHQPHSSLIGRHVKWLNKERHGLAKLGTVALASLETVTLSMTGVGILAVYSGWKESKRLNAEKIFFEELQKNQKDGVVSPPDAHEKIVLKSKTRSFNHTHDFAIQDGVIWTRLRNRENEWEPVFFDGHATGQIPVEIHADGANLVVLDQSRNVHYKKVLSELRGEEIQKNEKAQAKVEGMNIDVDQDAYVAIDKSTRNNWKDKWFTLPFVNVFVNLFTSKRLEIPSDIRSWAISQRGRFNDYLEDAVGHKHQVGTGVTTLYVLSSNGKDIYKYDPWSPKNIKVSISLPEDSEASFDALNMTASASTLMVVGYEIKKREDGQGIKKTLQIQTRLADIDSEGWNPGLKYDYFEHPDDKDVRVVPLPQWQNHPLELTGQAAITENITIHQIGEGNDARELRVEGIDQDGNKGYYFKTIDEDGWHFKQEDAVHLDSDFLPEIIESQDELFETTVYNYVGESIRLNTLQGKSLTASLYKFGQRSYESTLQIVIDGEAFNFHLQRKKTLKNFIGFSRESYDLVIPKELQNNELVKEAFKGRTVIPVKIKEKAEIVNFSLPSIGRIDFKKDLERQSS